MLTILRTKIVRHVRKTYKNKLWAVGLILFGAVSLMLSDDATVFAFTILMAIPLFFSKRNWIN